MAIPIAPAAGFVLRYAALAGAAYLAARRLERGRLAQAVEDEMDALPEGLAARREDGDVAATARIRRVVRLIHGGPGLSVDAALMGRLRLRRV